MATNDGPVCKYLQVSTGNLSKETAQLFERYTSPDREPCEGNFGLPVAYNKGEYGWFAHVPDDNEGIEPPELCALLDYARSLGCNWIEFDCDNDPLDGFPVFDW